jgi:hypothetical protein
VHTAADYSNYSSVDHAALQAFFESGKKSKKLLIYTSGILVYPNSNRVSDETTPTGISQFITNYLTSDDKIPLPLTDRPKFEQMVLDSKGNCIINNSDN